MLERVRVLPLDVARAQALTLATTTSLPPSAPHGFRPLLVYVEEVAREEERIRLGAILEELGRHGFGSVMLVAGLTTFVPLVGAAMPLMELVPFSANLGGLALTLVGLAWIARDGALAALLLLAAATGGGLLVVGLV